MSLVMIVFLCLFALHAQIADENCFWEDYCSKSRTTAIKGIFVATVFMSHFCSYIATGEQDALAVKTVHFLGQLMVTPFLFYSGFGVMEAIQKKGKDYVKKIPVHRALKTLLHFDVAILLFCVLNLILGEKLIVTDVLQAFVCWVSLGNSTWYIFTMVFLYLITAVSFLIFGRNKYVALIVTTALTVLYVNILMQYKGDWWYNTCLCYILGMWYSVLRPIVEKIACKNDLLYFATLLLACFAFYELMRRHRINIWKYQLYAMSFVVLVVGISMKIKLDNPFLQFLGKHTFSIYILQRLPMIYFTEKGIYLENFVILFVMCFLITCVLAIVFDKVLEKMDQIIFGGKPIALTQRK